MKIFSWNVNGLRAVQKKGFLDFFESSKADFFCLQEIKVQEDQLSEELLHPLKYHSVWSPAEKKGYSGVAIYSKREPVEVYRGLGVEEFDSEGRVLGVEYKDFILISAYFPNSQRDHARLDYKLRFCQKMYRFLNRLKKKGKNIILCGDYNIAHKEIDLKNPKTNQKNAGFLPEEREWMSHFLKSGYFDGLRHFSDEPEQYTWWSYRPGVRERNIGWRLDYFCSNDEFSDRYKGVRHLPEVMGSDHCPIELVLKK